MEERMMVELTIHRYKQKPVTGSPAYVDAFICSHCDCTHFEMIVPVLGAAFSLILSAKEAEVLGKALLSPKTKP